ncbi:MAG TPA: hypothetical protein VHL59_13705, partial [Thermoanaerobaculia bacterium]|nr:hypothetical protein [Thermoanaerobaculia bacterium]
TQHHLMAFPQHIERVLTTYGVRPDTKAALYDLYVSLGDAVLEVFSDIAEGVASVSSLRPEDTLQIRRRVVERFLRRNHPQWLAGNPTPSLWHPRVAEGRASGMATPLGEISDSARRAVGEGQPLPDGIVMLGRNAHFGGRAETISFDVVARDLDDAIALGQAMGQQHTLPGSAGETSGTFDSARGVALIWEVQPNVYKPQGERNREIAKLYRRHRNWHILTLVAALEWLRAQRCAVYILRGKALAAAHEVNRDKPVSGTIASLHDRTVEQVAGTLGFALAEPADNDELILLDSIVMNHALRKFVLQHGAAELISIVDFPENPG